MFREITTTKFPPVTTPILIWDGACGFCKYWVNRWVHLSEGKIVSKTYQEVFEQFPDIPIEEFKKASRLITPQGTVHSGPDSAYMSYYIANSQSPWHRWYTDKRWFKLISNHMYTFIAKHRSGMFQLTKMLLGTNPLSFTHYWIFYLIGMIGFFIFLFKIL